MMLVGKTSCFKQLPGEEDDSSLRAEDKQLPEDRKVELYPLSSHIADERYKDGDRICIQLRGNDSVIAEGEAHLRPKREAKAHLEVFEGDRELPLSRDVNPIVIAWVSHGEAGGNVPGGNQLLLIQGQTARRKSSTKLMMAVALPPLPKPTPPPGPQTH
ncbi:hypothetical protein KSP39_PZI020298 [Platanthera zijinensis]|uniref:Uncharacterized protein n=1 Tax=Platanthera zijinensis TaxID=2320716 RepID=A0AAP0AZ63_9ASPA